MAHIAIDTCMVCSERHCKNCVSWLNGIVSGEFERMGKMYIRKKETPIKPMMKRKEETINLSAVRIDKHIKNVSIGSVLSAH